MKNTLPSIVLSLLIVIPIGFLGVYAFKDYGWTIFLFTPFLLGFLPPYFYGAKYPLTKSQAFRLGFSALGLACLCLLVFALEGMICIIMASPLLVLFTAIGAYFGFQYHHRDSDNRLSQKQFFWLLIFSSIGFMSFDHVAQPVTTRGQGVNEKSFFLI